MRGWGVALCLVFTPTSCLKGKSFQLHHQTPLPSMGYAGPLGTLGASQASHLCPLALGSALTAPARAILPQHQLVALFCSNLSLSFPQSNSRCSHNGLQRCSKPAPLPSDLIPICSPFTVIQPPVLTARGPCCGEVACVQVYACSSATVINSATLPLRRPWLGR